LIVPIFFYIVFIFGTDMMVSYIGLAIFMYISLVSLIRIDVYLLMVLTTWG